MLLDGLTQWLACVQIGRARQSARQHDKVHLTEVYLTENHVGLYGNLVCPSDHRTVIDGNSANIQSGTAHNIHGSDGFHFLKTVCKKYCNHIPYIL